MKCLKIYFYLFVISVLVSQSLMDLFSVLFAAQWGWVVWQARKTKTPLKLLRPFGLEMVFVIWWIVCAVGFWLTPMDVSYQISRLLEFRWILLLYVMIEILRQVNPTRQSFQFLNTLFLGIGFATLLIFFLDIPLFSKLRYEDGWMTRAGGLFANPMTFAHSFSLLFCFMLGLALFNFKNWTRSQKIQAGLALTLGLTSVYLTYTRGVWIGVIAGVFIVLTFVRPRFSLIGFLALSLGVGVLFATNASFQGRLARTWAEAQGASERKLIWKGHFLEFQENPFFGLGYGQNTQLLPLAYERLGIPPETLVSHAHNQYLHLAAGTGVLGLSSYMLIWIFFLLLLLRLWKSQKLDSWDQGAVIGLLIGQISFLVAGLTEANFEHSKVRFMVLLGWAYTVFLADKYQVKAFRLLERKI